MSHVVVLNDCSVTVEIVARTPFLRLRIKDVTHVITEVHGPGAGEFEFIVDGRICRGWRYASADEVYVRVGGRTFVLHLPRFGDAGAAAGVSRDEVRAEMPGTVVGIECKEGQAVTAGEIIVTIESMKMQMGLPAPRDGVVSAVHFARNASFDRGAVLVSLAPVATVP
jgi:3-methylcrotonyl-CoA carboxylase alpha subunit